MKMILKKTTALNDTEDLLFDSPGGITRDDIFESNVMLCDLRGKVIILELSICEEISISSSPPTPSLNQEG